jgi:hypothetical protein
MLHFLAIAPGGAEAQDSLGPRQQLPTLAG